MSPGGCSCGGALAPWGLLTGHDVSRGQGAPVKAPTVSEVQVIPTFYLAEIQS